MIQDFPRFLGKRVSLSLFIPIRNHGDFCSDDPLTMLHERILKIKGTVQNHDGIVL